MAVKRPVFSPEFTGQRAQIISHDHTPHLECSDCQHQTLVACVPLSTKHFSSVQCSLSSIFRAWTVLKFKQFKWLLKICWFWGGAKEHIVSFVADPKGTLFLCGRPKGHIRAPKGHSVLWKRPSENPGRDLCCARQEKQTDTCKLAKHHGTWVHLTWAETKLLTHQVSKVNSL